jgi:hypothetical protein
LISAWSAFAPGLDELESPLLDPLAPPGPATLAPAFVVGDAAEVPAAGVGELDALFALPAGA